MGQLAILQASALTPPGGSQLRHKKRSPTTALRCGLNGKAKKGPAVRRRKDKKHSPARGQGLIPQNAVKGRSSPAIRK